MGSRGRAHSIIESLQSVEIAKSIAGADRRARLRTKVVSSHPFDKSRATRRRPSWVAFLRA
eukprot:15482895-Alexandrium_andersonii.AAC.1